MKKMTWLLAIILSLPAGAIWARDTGSGGGGGERGGGGWSGGGERGGGGGSDNSAGSNSGSWDSTDHSSNNNNHAYSNSVRSNGGNFRSGGNAYYRNGSNGYYRQRGYGSAGYGQVRHYNRSYGSHGSNGANFRSNSTGLHHFNSSTGASVHSYASGSPRALSHSSILPHSLQHSSVRLPSQGPSGKAFSASLVSPGRMNSSMVRTQMSSIAHNSAFSARVAVFNHSDSLRNHYYWHSWGGRDFCHFYDRFGCNWYGWGWGGSFFWTQWYGDNWWWYDPWNARWCYWWGDGWWWQDPSNTTVYIYENGNYVPGDQANANTDGKGYNQPPSDNEAGQPNGESPSGNVAGSPSNEENPSVPNTMVEFPSPDKARTVKIVGESGDAFLYDSAKNSFKPLFLESDVKNVQFSKSNKGALKIKLILSDGSYEIFDAQGKQLKEADAPKTGQSVDVEADNT